MQSDLKVVAHFYDFMLWLIRHTEKFPRHHRYSLGSAMDPRRSGYARRNPDVPGGGHSPPYLPVQVAPWACQPERL